LRTRDTGATILRGVTRTALLGIASELQMKIDERPFTLAEAKGAREAFITAASAFVMPVVKIDGVEVAGGQVGPVAKRLRALYLDAAKRTAV
jgi:D-alanine transaminase